MDRTAICKSVLEAAEKAVAKRSKRIKLETFSQIIQQRAISLLGHLIRLPDADPMKQATLRNNKPIFPPTRRVGIPKHNWTRQSFEKAWKVAKNDNPTLPGHVFTGTDEQYQILTELANLRKPPFDTKKSKHQEPTQNAPGGHCPHPTHDGELSSHTTHETGGLVPPVPPAALHNFVAGAPLAVTW